MESFAISTTEIKKFYNGMLPHLSLKRPRHERVIAGLSKIVTPLMTVLDVGCGAGITTNALSSICNVTGIDIADGLIEYARTEYPHIEFISGDFRTVDLGRKFDLVCLIDVMEHIPREDVGAFLANVKRHSSSMIYLNIPDGRYLDHLKMFRPGSLQIIDEPYEISEILAMFSLIGYSPFSMAMYGAKGIPEYQEYLFVTDGELERQYSRLTGQTKT